MVRLYEVSKKLEDLLNGIDSETPAGYTPNFEYVVATEGFHLDKISDKSTHKNFIPVFIGSLGGTYNAVPNLKEADYTIPVTIYFPVRFKNDFYALNDYLVDLFVGKMLTYGTYSGKCLSNISVAQYGELAELDLDQFKEWVAGTYAREVNIKQPYMSMTFNLYLSTIGSGYHLGNDALMDLTLTFDETYTTSVTYHQVVYSRDATKDEQLGANYYLAWTNNTTTYYTLGNDDSIYNVYVGQSLWKKSDATFVYQGSILHITTSTRSITKTAIGLSSFDDLNIQSNTEPAGQQLIGQVESDGLPITTAYSGGFTLYYKDNVDLLKTLLKQWCYGNSQKLKLQVSIYGFGASFLRDAYLSSCHLSLKKGEPITFTISFAKRKV